MRPTTLAPQPGGRPATVALWPGGLVGRVFLVLIGALALELAGSLLLYQGAARLLPTAETVDDLAGRLVRTGRVMSELPADRRAATARAASGDGVQFAWLPVAPSADADRAPLRLTVLQAGLVRLRPELAQAGLAIRAGSEGDDVFREVAGTVRLADGSALAFTADRLVEAESQVGRALLSVALLAAVVLLAAGMVVHTLTAPLRRLARAAGAIGHGPPVHVADERGPREVREVARALNAMGERITALVADRTEALAAVSHDLRTPIARMRLRLSLGGAGEWVAPLEADLAEMEAMIAAVLAYLGGAANAEPARPVDLSSVLQTLVDDAADAGADIAYHGPDACRVAARPLELKRALSNLVENARQYGGPAPMTVTLTPGLSLDGRPAVRVTVEDGGPGIPEGELERVLEPFHRVDGSRNAGRGGIGLGLAIVRRAVERDGGRITLGNRPGGGLCASVLLPVDVSTR